MTHAVRVELQDLVHQPLRLLEVAPVLVPGGGMVQLLDPALPLPFLDESLAQRLVRLRVVGVVGHSPFELDRKSTRLNSSHSQISYAVFCLKKKKNVRH